MNMLTDSLPRSLTVAGSAYPIDTDYRAWIRYELLLTSDTGKTDEEIFREILRLVFPEETSNGGSGGEELFRYDYDDGYIAAAFKQQYGVCLSREQLHWWEFRAYMLALSEDTEFVKIMGFRCMRIDPKLPAASRNYYQRMKQLYKLPVAKELEESRKRLDEALMNGESIDGLL